MTIMRISNVSLACARKDLMMAASVTEVELAARKTNEVCKTVLRGTTFVLGVKSSLLFQCVLGKLTAVTVWVSQAWVGPQFIV